MDPEVIRYLLDVNINEWSINEIIRDMSSKFGVDYTDKKEEIENLLIDLHYPENSGNDDDDLAFARKLQDQELRRSGRSVASTPLKPRKQAKRRFMPRESNIKPNAFTRQLAVSESLQNIIGKAECSRPEAVQLLWKYIKENNLQDSSDKRFIICDELMFKVIKKRRVHCFKMNKEISRHLIQIEPGKSDGKSREDNYALLSNEALVEVPREWVAYDGIEKTMTYHQLQLNVINQLREYRSVEDPDKIIRPKDHSIVTDLFPDGEQHCSTFDILRRLKQKTQQNA